MSNTSKVRNHEAPKYADGGVYHGKNAFSVKEGKRKRSIFVWHSGYAVKIGEAVWRGSRWHINSIYSRSAKNDYVFKENNFARMVGRLVWNFGLYGKIDNERWNVHNHAI